MAEVLTKRQKKLTIFVNEYVQEFNGTKAAIAAGYSAKTAAQAASRLLKDAKVKAMIAERTKGAMLKVEASADAALERLAVTSDAIITALAEMGLAHKAAAKFLRVSTGGDLYYDFTGATEEELLALQPMIAELTTESYTEGRGENKRDVIRAKVKFVDRKGVLELLGRWKTLTMWTDTLEVNDNRSLDEIDARIRELQLKDPGYTEKLAKDPKWQDAMLKMGWKPPIEGKTPLLLTCDSDGKVN